MLVTDAENKTIDFSILGSTFLITNIQAFRATLKPPTSPWQVLQSQPYFQKSSNNDKKMTLDKMKFVETK